MITQVLKSLMVISTSILMHKIMHRPSGLTICLRLLQTGVLCHLYYKLINLLHSFVRMRYVEEHKANMTNNSNFNTTTWHDVDHETTPTYYIISTANLLTG